MNETARARAEYSRWLRELPRLIFTPRGLDSRGFPIVAQTRKSTDAPTRYAKIESREVRV